MARKKPAPARQAGLQEQLRAAIRSSGRTLTDLAEATGVGKDRLSRFVNGKRGLGLPAIEALCRELRLRLVRHDG